MIMADFSLELLRGFDRVLNGKKLEGLDVENVGIRIGLHSGPVTAGVLRGGRCTYQLYGATVYEANRMEQTGRAGSVQISYVTAQLLRMGGWQHLIVDRNDYPRSDDLQNNIQKNTFWIYRDEDVHVKERILANNANSSEESKRNGWMRVVASAATSSPRRGRRGIEVSMKSEKSSRFSSRQAI